MSSVYRLRLYFSLCIVLLLCLSNAVADGLEPRLEISVSDDAVETNIRKLINPARYECSVESWQLERFRKQVERQTELTLQAFGYYHGHTNIRIEHSASCWLLQLDIDAGPRVVVHSLNIDLSGELGTLPASNSLQENSPLQVGVPLNHADYTQIKSDIKNLAARYGFFSGEFSQSLLEIDPLKNQAKIILHFNAGPRSVFGNISVQQTEFDDQFIAQFIKIGTGQPYDRNELLVQQQVLNGSGYFDSVKVVADTAQVNDGNTVPVNIELQAVKRHLTNFGVGASTDTGPRVSFGYNNRRLMRKGHQFSFDTVLSPVRQEVSLDYGIPRGKSGTKRLDFQAGYLYEDVETVEQESFKLALLDTDTYDSGWIRTAFIEYLDEDFIVASTPGSSKLLMPGGRLKKTVADYALFPRNGWHSQGSVRIAGEDTGSSTDLLQLNFSYKHINPLLSGRFLSRINLGVSIVGDFKKLPASLRYFAGGDGSVRGFDYKTLGPLNAAGEVTGGENSLTASLEYEHPVKEKWGLALFIDTGNAFNSWGELDLYTGVGLGVRWHSPIGPIRLDLAQDVTGENSPRLHLSMGLDL